MEKVEKYRDFLSNIAVNHPDKAFFESVLTAYNILFEADSGIQTADTDEADKLSSITKQIKDISKEEQDAIYSKFISIDPKNLYPQQTISMIFNNLKNMISHLMEDKSELGRVMDYLNGLTA